MAAADIGIVVPVYQMPEALHAALASIEAQREITAQIIVCDGGSDAATLEVLKRFAHLSIHHSRTPDKGVYDAMNRGMALAKAEWLYFLGADDRLAHPHTLSELLKAADATHDLVCGRVNNLPPRAKGVHEWFVPSWGPKLVFKNTIHHQGVLYRTTALQGYSYPSALRVLGDYHLNLWLYRRRINALCTNTLVAECSPGGLSKRFNRRLYFEEWWLKRQLLPLHQLLWQPLWLTAKYLYKQL
jgi:putative colanic acid biosynthesis glycosyltransferase